MSAEATPSDITSSTWGGVFQYFDGSFLDVGSILVAVCFVLWHRGRQPKTLRCPFLSRETGRLLVNAVSIFPLLLLACSILSSKITAILLGGNRIILTIAGCYALFTMLEDLISTSSALQKKNTEEPFVGPPAPKLAPAGHEPLQPQAGKVLAVHTQVAIADGLTRSQRKRRARAERKKAAAQQDGV